MLSVGSDVPKTASAGPGAWASEPPTKLAGARVLVVEDEAMVAMLIEDMLLDAGCEVVGPAPGLDAAFKLLKSETVDVAVLDINLGGEMVFPLADALAARGVPFVFSTGYGVAGLDERHLDRPVLQKPYEPERLHQMLSSVLTRS